MSNCWPPGTGPRLVTPGSAASARKAAAWTCGGVGTSHSKAVKESISQTSVGVPGSVYLANHAVRSAGLAGSSSGS